MKTEMDYCVMVEAPHGFQFVIGNPHTFCEEFGGNGDEEYNEKGLLLVNELKGQLDLCKVGEDGDVLLPNTFYVDVNEKETYRFEFAHVDKDEFGNVFVYYNYVK